MRKRVGLTRKLYEQLFLIWKQTEATLPVLDVNFELKLGVLWVAQKLIQLNLG